MLHKSFEIRKFDGTSLHTTQISGVGDKVVPLVREVVCKAMEKEECSVVVHFRKAVTHKGAFTPELAAELMEAIKATPKG